jgi:hypothetical protein
MKDHLRAIVITAHIAVVFILAFPAPGGAMHERAFKSPALRAWWERAAAVSTAVGRPMETDEAAELAWAIGRRWQRARRRTVQHLQFYVKYCGVKQGWTMFGKVHRRPGRLEVHLEENGEWRPLFVPLHPEHDWREGQLRQERIRGYISDFALRRREGTFPRLAQAIAQRAAADFPDATRVRARMVPLLIPKPAKLRSAGEIPLGAPYFESIVPLDPYR